MTENNKLRIEHITSQDGKSVLYRLAGQMVVSKECYELLDTLRDDIRAGRARVVLNLENLERINSTGVGIFASAFTATQRAEGSLVLVKVPDRIRRILEVAHLLSFLEISDSEEASFPG